MDEILLLLMHVQTGLRVSEAEVMSMLKGDPGRPAEALASSEARGYLADRPGWREDSLRMLEETPGIRWSRIGDPDYPRGWLGLSRRPLVFSYRGEPCWKNGPLFAVVGSRTPTGDTRMWMQRELAPFLREHRAAVVSGGARGVDQIAHRLSMDVNLPTVCVLPSGVLNPYPPGNQDFWERIVDEGGSLLSTFAPGEGMRRHHFEVRNRWIVGLAPAVFVVEANRRSGSSLTAQLAREENREICTLPVFPHSEQGLGNLDLLACGAQMIRDQADLGVLWERCRLSPAFLE